jgi:ribosomal protein S18 acetylase RimI-like enzyme
VTSMVLRSFTDDDVIAASEIADRYHQAAFGHPTFYSPDLLRSALERPTRIPELDAMAVERDGRLISAALVFASPPFSEVRLGFICEPDLSVADATECLRLVTDRFDDAVAARMNRPGAAADPHEVVDLPASMGQFATALTACGFRMGRHVHEMFIDLAGGMPAPTWPTGFTWRTPTLEPRDVDAMSLVFEGAFVDHPGDGMSADEVAHDMAMPSTSLPLSIIAEDDAGPVGVTFTMVEEQGGYIGGLGVLPRGRRRGLATAMLQQAFSGLAAAGVPCCRLHVEAVNPGAVALYEQVGMTPESVTDIWLRPARR